MLFYSPRAHIKQLWKEIFAMVEKRKKLGLNDSDSTYSNIFDKEISDRKNLINVLLDFYFNSEEDEEFIQENRP